ncbi:AAA family ATPase [Candidatus Poribacteria bacterium]|nr:AAA family ATPase [Candidatus Poribacteria bacterium]MYH79157.1 AAA family ATPase [Candidatus Poribacteria bacterium]MYK93426.1 AAA family ATPase [Candidatus Poribacteria bacterium]
METLQGILERIVYESHDTGYTVGRLSARDHAELITVVGNLASINPGESLLLQGEWVDNPRYGRQFQIEKYETILPANVVGLRKYLGSGLIKGIGPKMAALIVRKFGMDTMDIIENEPDKLASVPGIGRKRVEIIKEAWEAQREIKNVMIFLQSHDVSTTHAAKIYKTYGNDAIPVVTENPYQLADDIYGIGFVTADTIAQKLGMDQDAPQRVEAGIKYVLSQKADEGHVFQHCSELVEACQTMLEQELAAIEQGIHALVEKEEIISPGFTDFPDADQQVSIDEIQENYEIPDARQEPLSTLTENGTPIAKSEAPVLGQNQQLITENHSPIYLAPFYYAELGIANQFSRLLASQEQNPVLLPPNTTRLLTQLENEMDLHFAPQQRNAILTAMTTRAMILTGGPGTGKTTTVVGMIRLFKAQGRRITLTAPTGRAAKRLSETTGGEAKTIHRLLEFSPQINSFKRNRQNPLDTDVVIVDEMSMVDLVLMNRLMQAIRPSTTVIVIGDTDQLPSVGAGNVLKALIDSRKISVIALTEIFRQAQESMIVANAHRINKGDYPELTGDPDRNFFFIEEEDPEVITELICSLIADRLPQHYNYHPIDDIQLLCPMRRGVLGTENLNKRLQEVLNPQYVTPVIHPLVKARFGPGTHSQAHRSGNQSATIGGFRVGDKVMQIRNNYDYDVFNGDIGRVVAIEIEGLDKKVLIQYPDKQVAYDAADLGELVLAYATTIHKAQGSEYPAVVIPLHTQHYLMLQRNLLYTGITRARERVVIVGTEKALGICIRNNQVMQRNSYLAERLQEGWNRN